MPAKLSTAEYLAKLKANSSRWFRAEFKQMDFRWQRGYAAFSVSPSRLAELQRYIDRQEANHAELSFADEVRKLVEGHGIPFDERALQE
jgi:putative transposase